MFVSIIPSTYSSATFHNTHHSKAPHSHTKFCYRLWQIHPRWIRCQWIPLRHDESWTWLDCHLPSRHPVATSDSSRWLQDVGFMSVFSYPNRSCWKIPREPAYFFGELAVRVQVGSKTLPDKN